MTIRPARIRSVLAAVAAVLTLGAVTGAGPAGAMVNGTPDFAHPESGALYFSATPDGPRGFACSGVLIDTQVFLTAAH